MCTCNIIADKEYMQTPHITAWIGNFIYTFGTDWDPFFCEYGDTCCDNLPISLLSYLPGNSWLDLISSSIQASVERGDKSM